MKETIIYFIIYVCLLFFLPFLYTSNTNDARWQREILYKKKHFHGSISSPPTLSIFLSIYLWWCCILLEMPLKSHHDVFFCLCPYWIRNKKRWSGFICLYLYHICKRYHSHMFYIGKRWQIEGIMVDKCVCMCLCLKRKNVIFVSNKLKEIFFLLLFLYTLLWHDVPCVISYR